MELDNRNSEGQDCCSDDCDCGSQQNSAGGRKLRMFASLVIILAAVAVTAYSLYSDSAPDGDLQAVPVAAPSALILESPAQISDHLADCDFFYLVLPDGQLDTSLDKIVLG